MVFDVIRKRVYASIMVVCLCGLSAAFVYATQCDDCIPSEPRQSTNNNYFCESQLGHGCPVIVYLDDMVCAHGFWNSNNCRPITPPYDKDGDSYSYRLKVASSESYWECKNQVGAKLEANDKQLLINLGYTLDCTQKSATQCKCEGQSDPVSVPGQTTRCVN